MKILVLLVTMYLFQSLVDVSSVAYASISFSSYKQGELIVRFKDQKKISKSISDHRSSLIKKLKYLPIHHIKIPGGAQLQDILADYRKDPNVLYAEPNYIIRKSSIPNDTEFVRQWNLPVISAPSAWDLFTGSRMSESVLVAVLDTGIAYYHPDLVANLWTNPGEICGDGLDNDNNGIIDDCYGANFGGFTPGDPWDDDTADSHGTHVAGIIGAVGNNGLGITGVNWATRIMAVKFLHGPEGMGELIDALRGVEYAISKGAKIINMSFEVDEDSQSLRDAAKAVEDAGALMISAAGNTGKNLDEYSVFPASIRSSNNIAVAASSPSDGRPSYSDYGRHTVELAAPGGVSTGSPDGVLSTVWLGTNGSILYRTTAGTSMAVPHVTGAAALVWNKTPLLSALQVKARILNGVDHISAFADNTITGGRLNLDKTLNSLDLPAVFDVLPYQLNLNGGIITVKGVNFGTGPGAITLGNKNLTATSWTDTEISALIPQNSSGGIVLVNGRGNGFPLSIMQNITISSSTVSGVAPLTVELNATVQSDASILKYEWDFGDGVFRELQGVSSYATHTFDTADTYVVRVRTVDNAGDTGIGSITITVAPLTSTGNGSGCFIATAAYGSYLHPHVHLLRDFRDQQLLTNRIGQSFVRLYYRLSPPIAHFIAKHESLRIIFRAILTPFVFSLIYPLISILIVIIGCIAVIYGYYRRVVCKQVLRTDEAT
ncbi:MAG: S8 family serine peptidase [Desulfuromonadaceae bacterium]|nr:S8 family serine peptidase [Desulfuromonadaceae bacterium]